MRKLAICTIGLLLVVGLFGCSGKKNININDITSSTMLARANGELQVATMEKFDKPYYDMDELKKFIDKEVASYNKSTGADSIKVNKIEMKDNQAVMLLTYKGMKDYATFNKVAAAYFTGGNKDIGSLNLPDTLISYKNQSKVSTQSIVQDTKYKILLLNEPYHIKVEGKIKFYSDNAKPVSDGEVQGGSKGQTIVVY